MVLAAYRVLAVVGLVGTWWFNLQSFDDPQGYVAGWFANPASSSVAVDIMVVGAAACVFMLIEGRRLGMRHGWVHVVLTFAVALAFSLPLFLARREAQLRDRDGSARPARSGEGSAPDPA